MPIAGRTYIGDAQTGNIMLPRTAGGAVALIDWQLWGIDVPLLDVAFLMALHWLSGRRATSLAH